MSDYILDTTIKNLNNYELLVYATETFRQFAYFLIDNRNYKKLKLKIGTYNYDDWKADLYLEIKNNKVKFVEIRNTDDMKWEYKTLTENLIYAWGFNEIEFKINFDLINNIWKLLNHEEKEKYDSLYYDVHSELW